MATERRLAIVHKITFEEGRLPASGREWGNPAEYTVGNIEREASSKNQLVTLRLAPFGEGSQNNFWEGGLTSPSPS